jgi:hypothetical protein
MAEYEFRALKQWPRQQTPSHQRGSPFQAGLNKTWPLLDKELRALGVRGRVVIEAGFRDQDIRMDGRPYASAPNPNFPGVVISFESKHGPLRFMCDDCHRWEDNIRAIAMTLERLRMAELYGVTKDGEQYKGWKALPAPGPTNNAIVTVEDAARFMETASTDYGGLMTLASAILNDRDVYRRAYRATVKVMHPDSNPEVAPENWSMLQAAQALLDRHHGV